MKKIMLITVALLAIASEASATKVARPRGGPCTMQENVSLSVNFNIKTKSFAEAKTKYDEKIQQLEAFAKQQNIQEFNVQSMNYNVSAQTTYDNGKPEQGYQLGGNASFQLDSADNAFKLGEFLTQQQFQVNISVNKYKNGNCNVTSTNVE